MQRSKNTLAFFILLAVTAFSSLVIVSCNNSANKNQVLIDIPADSSGLDKINHFIDESTIAKYKEAFRSQRDSVARMLPLLMIPGSEAFNKRAILSLLKPGNCVGIRIYYGLKPGRKNEFRLILVGVDATGKDILISQDAILSAKLSQTMGGIENGQCPDCQKLDQ